MKYIQPAIILILVFFLFKISCSNKKDAIFIDSKKPEEQSKFYLDQYLIENKKRLQADAKAKELILVYESKLKYWQNRKQIIKISEPIEDIIDCNDTIIKIRNIAHINDSLCIDLVSRSQKVFKAKDSVILYQNNEINNLNKSIDYKTIENDAIKSNFEKSQILLKKEKRKKWICQIATGIFLTTTLLK